MALDVQAPLRVKSFPLETPEEVQTSLLTLEEAKAKRQARMDESADRAALSTAIKTHVGPDGTPDIPAVTSALSQFPRAQQAWLANVAKMREDGAKAHKAELDNHDKEAEIVARIFQGVNDESGYQSAYQMLSRFDPAGAKAFGPQYDPGKVQRAVNAGTGVVEFNKRERDALTDLMEGKPARGAAATLSLANSPEDWANRLHQVALYAPDEAKRWAQMPFSPDAVAQARQSALTVEQQVTREDKQATAKASQANTEADNARMAAAQASTEAHQRAQEDIARGQLGVARGQLSVAQGNLSVRKQETSTGAGGAKLSAAAVEKLAGVEQSLSIIGDLDQFLAKGADKYIGPVEGRLTNARLSTPGMKVSQNLAEFAAQITTLKNAVIKATTGAAMSEPEAKRIMGQVPDMTNKPEVFRARMSTTKRNLEMLKRRTIELSGGTVSEPTPSSAAPAGVPPQVLKAGPGRHTFGNGQIWDVSADGKSARQIK